MQKIENDQIENIKKYAKFELTGTSWLGFRDIPALIERYAKSSKRVLDYGCGAGRSTRFLQSLKLNAMGADVSANALSEAKRMDFETFYILIENGRIPVVDEFYDFVFSSYVFLVINSKSLMLSVLKEIYRVLKKNGILILITGSEELHSRKNEWLSYDVNFSENESLISGCLCKVKNKEVDAVFYDYHWTDQIYREVFEKAAFTLLETHQPLGLFSDGYEWKSEFSVSPHVIYVLRK